MIAARAAGRSRPLALAAALGVAVTARVAAGGSDPAASAPAAVLFVVILVAALAAGGVRPSAVPWTGVLLGAAGGVALVVLALVGAPSVTFGPRAVAGTLAWWVPLVSAVAATEELVLRGVLFAAVRERAGDAVAVAVMALLFALIHLPLYGVASLPLDVAVGVFLGCLRVASGSVTAPLVAHAVADLATGWVG